LLSCARHCLVTQAIVPRPESALETRSRDTRADEAFETTSAKDVVTKCDVASKTGCLTKMDHVGIAFRHVGGHLVQSKVVEAVVEHEKFGLLCDATAPVLHFADEDRSELTAPIAPVEMHDPYGPHWHSIVGATALSHVGRCKSLTATDEPEATCSGRGKRREELRLGCRTSWLVLDETPIDLWHVPRAHNRRNILRLYRSQNDALGFYHRGHRSTLKVQTDSITAFVSSGSMFV
jgi:hypothetical protein